MRQLAQFYFVGWGVTSLVLFYTNKKKKLNLSYQLMIFGPWRWFIIWPKSVYQAYKVIKERHNK